MAVLEIPVAGVLSVQGSSQKLPKKTQLFLPFHIPATVPARILMSVAVPGQSNQLNLPAFTFLPAAL
jgi:hypothetical protein